jgi:sugar lactone lactonase YvrE
VVAITGLTLTVTAAAEAAPIPGGPAVTRGTATAATSGGAGVHGTTSGARLWAARFAPARSSIGDATAASPDGSTVFVAGELDKPGTARGSSAEVVAYNATTGAVVWKSRYAPQKLSTSKFSLRSIVVSPDGSAVFVAGHSSPNLQSSTHESYLTIAYNAATGAKLWVDHDKQIPGVAEAIAISPDGSAVFVTGRPASGDPVTVAYNAATGATLWTQNTGLADGTSIAASPDGSAVYITGTPAASGGPSTMALSAATGTTLWTQNTGVTSGVSVAAAPDGSAVYVTGGKSGSATAAYSAATGKPLWLAQSNVVPSELVVSPDGSKVFITGSISKKTSATYGTVAYDASTGTSLWESHYPTAPRAGAAYALAVSPDGSTLYVTGQTTKPGNGLRGYGTVAYNASTGAQLWASRDLSAYTGFAFSIAVSPDGSKVFVTGYLMTPAPSRPVMVTVAYNS